MKSTIVSRCSGAALLLCCLAGAAQAGETYYRWTDDNGTVVNSDRPPPPGIDYQVIGTTAGLKVPPDDEPEQAAPSASSSAPAQPAPEKTAQAQHQAAQKDPKACEDARQNLVTLSTYGRIRIADGNGSFRYLNQDEIADQRVQAEAAVSQFCE